MGVKEDKPKYLPKDFKYEISDKKDPKGNEYVNVADL